MRGHQGTRQHHDAVFAALGVAHDDHQAHKIHVLDAQAHALHHAHAGAIQQPHQQVGDALHVGQDAGDLVFGEHTGDARRPRRTVDVVEPGQIDVEHLAVQEQNGAQRLVVGGGGHMAFGGQHGQKSLDSFGVDLARMPHGTRPAGPADEKAHPVPVHLFGSEAIVHVTNALAHLAQQAAGLQWGRAGFHGKFVPGCLSSIGTGNPGCKPVSGGFDGQLIEHPPF
jgi:hypothetical protein